MSVERLSINTCTIGDGDDAIVGRIESGLAVCMWNRFSRKGGAVLLSGLTGAPDRIPSLLRSLASRLGDPADNLQCKLVGGQQGASPPEVHAAVRLLREMGIQIKAQDLDSGPVREIVFYPATGRLRVARILREEQPPVKKRVVVIDDSPTVRQLLTHLFSNDPGLEVVGSAEDGRSGKKLIRELKPDVVTLDIHMPVMTGPELLAELMSESPIPVVMISSQRPEDGPEVLRCLEIGAVDYIRKPALAELAEHGTSICETVKVAANSRLARPEIRPRTQVHTPGREPLRRKIGDGSNVLAIGASTGGTEAIKDLLLQLTYLPPPTVIVQHIPAVFSQSFAARLNELCPFEVKEAEDGDELRHGRVLIAPGGFQMKVERSGSTLRVRITDEPACNRHKPSVDVLFNSVAAHSGPSCMGIVLTGMGADGAAGLLNIRHAGGRTMVQNEETSVVFGMPREALRIGAAERSGSLAELADWIDRWHSSGRRDAG